jgi:hypothetical protein
VATITTVSATCFGYSDGSITVTNVSGGFGGPFQIKLGEGGTFIPWTSSTTFSSKPAGGYEIYIRDSAGRVVMFVTAIGQNSQLNLTTSNTSNSITATAYGNSSFGKTFELYEDVAAPYENGGGYMVTSIYVASGDPFTATFSTLGSGYYYVTVVEDNTACFETSGLITL